MNPLLHTKTDLYCPFCYANLVTVNSTGLVLCLGFDGLEYCDYAVEDLAEEPLLLWQVKEILQSV